MKLANQVFWLNQLGLGDYRKEFREAVTETYPAELDDNISDQQFGNKIYTLTHIIIAASEYYRYPVDYDKYNEITDYFRNNLDSILVLDSVWQERLEFGKFRTILRRELLMCHEKFV